MFFCLALKAFQKASFRKYVMPATSSTKSVAVQGTAGSQQLLKFMRGNAKLGKDVWTFSLPSGHTCPGACKCLAKVDRTTNQLIEGPQNEFRCFSATAEVAFPTVRAARRYNMDMLTKKTKVEDLMDMLVAALPLRAEIMRLHVAGDFYSQNYFDAWQLVAEMFPHCQFYAYTKSIPFWLNWVARYKKLPDNMILTASIGGRFDNLIQPWMQTAQVVDHPDDAEALGLEIDKNDTHAQVEGGSFALLIHSVQRPGSDKAAAVKRLKAEGIEYAYSR